MAIDFEAFKSAYEAAHVKARANRDSASDHTEAKANVVVERILNGGVREVEDVLDVEDPIDDEIESINFVSTRENLVPPREQAGLENPDIVLDESQVAAIETMAQHQYACMIGAAGSGKTTVTKYFISKIIYGDEKLGIEPMRVKWLPGKQAFNIALCAFTGIATQVIKQNFPEWLHPACKTIHSLLEYAPVITEVVKPDGSMKQSQVFLPSRHKGNKLDHDIIVIDEASMVGVDLWHYLLDACKPGTRIFLIGDLNQLPPVTSHSMFAYALSEWKVAELTHIHRQKEPAANRIIDVAHSILKGQSWTFDEPKENANWRVAGFQLPNDPLKAGQQIVSICNALRTRRVKPEVDPEENLIYDPYRDRIITAGNGYDENNTGSAVQQYWLNETLSQLILPPDADHPRYIIDADRGVQKRFAVGHRVMATRNEPPDVPDRVTNGMVGIIRNIEKNLSWDGNWAFVGPEHLVNEARKQQAARILNSEDQIGEELRQLEDLANIDFGNLNMSSQDSNKREGGGPASHRVTVEFANGAIREFANKIGVGTLMLAYASTCHKCQGSQFDTAIIVVHHIAKSQLSREWLYTAVTRATKRVILLYTEYGVKNALAKQRIFGQTLQQKIQRYKALQEEGLGPMKVRVRLSVENKW